MKTKPTRHLMASGAAVQRRPTQGRTVMMNATVPLEGGKVGKPSLQDMENLLKKLERRK